MDVDDLRPTIQNGLDDGDFSLSYLWISFWANGGVACRTELNAYVHGLQSLSDHDMFVLRWVMSRIRMN